MKEATKFIEKQRKATLGPMIDIAIQEGIAEGELRDRLAAFKEERNWLIHRCSHENGRDMFKTSKRVKLLERVLGFKNESIALRRALFNDMCTLFEAEGGNVEYAERLSEAQIKDMMGL